MKKILVFMLLIAWSVYSIAQAPEFFNYQSIVRNSDGDPVINQNVNFRFIIQEGSPGGTTVFSETQVIKTNELGLCNIKIGEGSDASGSLGDISWGSNSYYLNIAVDITGSTTFVDVGTVELVSVPYALYAQDVANKDDADPDPQNEIQDLHLESNVLTITNNASATEINLSQYVGSNTDEQELNLDGTTLSITGGNDIDVSSLVNDADYDPSNEFQDLTLSNDTIYISDGNYVKLPPDNVDDMDHDKTNELQDLTLIGDTLKISYGNEVVFPYDSSYWVKNASDVYYNTGNVGIGTSKPMSKLEVKADALVDTLFSVKDKDGNVVFAVFPDGAKVYVNETTKGKVGGFAVTGRNPAKGMTGDYFVITSDSARIYINDTTTTKGKVGGFAVTGRNPGKGPYDDYLRVTEDSTRVYINETSKKGKVGGFAVTGRNPAKGSVTGDYFNVSGNTTAEIIRNESRVMWYPKKAALLAGEVHVGSADSVGFNSTAIGYRNIAMGNYSQAMGYQAKSLGINSTAMGYKALANDSNSFAFGNYAEANGKNSFAFGDSAIVEAQDGYAIGAYAYTSGRGSFAIGSKDRYFSDNFELRTTATGELSMAVGLDADAEGYQSVALGNGVHATADYSVALGRSSTASGDFSFAMKGGLASGFGALAIGGQASNSGSISLGNGESSGYYSVTIGTNTEATADYSIAMGYGAEATGEYTTAVGFATAQSYSSFACGLYNKLEGNTGLYIETDPLFVIGNGTYAVRANAFTVLKNGQTSIGNITPSARLHISSVAGEVPLKIDIDNSTNVIVNSDGDVGIGTAGPNSKLHVNSATDQDGLRVQINGSTKLLVDANGGVSVGQNITPPAEGLFVKESVAVGTGTAYAPLHVYDNIDADLPTNESGSIMIGSGTGSNLIMDANEIMARTSGTTAGPLYLNNQGGNIILGNASSTVYVYGTFSNTSDKRLKNTIKPLTYGLKETLQLKPISFYWNDKNNSKLQLGFIAQDLQLVLPELISTREDGYLSIDYIKLFPILVNSIQEQQVIIQKQNDKLKAIQADVNELKTENEELKQKLNEIIELLKK